MPIENAGLREDVTNSVAEDMTVRFAHGRSRGRGNGKPCPCGYASRTNDNR